jgi:cellulose biosynthesis protein BcsQ
MSNRYESGQIITFYSYKGGTGRSMALANVACLLASQQPGDKGILMIDWDLEAPGLHRFFQNRFLMPQSTNKQSIHTFDDIPGLIDLFIAYNERTPSKAPENDNEATAIARGCLSEVQLEDYIVSTNIPHLSLMKAGCFDGQYSTRVNTFDWEDLYNRSPLLIPLFAERLTSQYRYVLIDSRTGLTDISGICTMLMPERLVVVFTPNRQSLTGLLDLIQRATRYRRQSDDLRPLLIFPLPSRIEVSEPRRREAWRFGDTVAGIEGYQLLFEKLFREVYELPKCDLSGYFDEIQVPHVPPYAYGEEIAVLIEHRGDTLSMARSYRAFTERLTHSEGPWAEFESYGAAQLSKTKEELAETRIAYESQVQKATKAKRTVWVGAVAASVAILVLIFFFFGIGQQKKMVGVPNILGQPMERARMTLKEVGLVVGEQLGEQSARFEPGTILRQDPQAGELLKEGSKINVVIAEKPIAARGITVPNVVGRPLEEARALLVESGLRVAAVREMFTNERPSGTVLDQNPRPGTLVERGGDIELTIARPPKIERRPGVEETSRTKFSLPGDSIIHFRVVEQQGLKLTIDVEYTYNERHGDKVMVGAWLKPSELLSGYTPTYVPHPGKGTARVPISLGKPGVSTEIEIFLYEWGKPSEVFARRNFPYKKRFE